MLNLVLQSLIFLFKFHLYKTVSLINLQTKEKTLSNELKYNTTLTNYFSLSINSKLSLFLFILFLHDVIYNNKQIDISQLTDAYKYDL